MSDVQAFADRLLTLGIEIHVRGHGSGRLWLWPAKAYRELPAADHTFISEHRDELKDLVRAGLAPRLPEDGTPPAPATAAVATPAQCPYCERVCVGPEHRMYGIYHWNDPAEIARRNAAKTAEMTHQLGRY